MTTKQLLTVSAEANLYRALAKKCRNAGEYREGEQWDLDAASIEGAAEAKSEVLEGLVDGAVKPPPGFATHLRDEVAASFRNFAADMGLPLEGALLALVDVHASRAAAVACAMLGRKLSEQDLPELARWFDLESAECTRLAASALEDLSAGGDA